MEKAPAAICLGSISTPKKYPRLAQQRLLNFSTRAGRGVRHVDPFIFVCDFDYDFLSDETKCALTLVL